MHMRDKGMQLKGSLAEHIAAAVTSLRRQSAAVSHVHLRLEQNVPCIRLNQTTEAASRGHPLTIACQKQPKKKGNSERV